MKQTNKQTLWGSPCMHTHSCTCTSAGTLQGVRGLHAWPFSMTPSCRQPHSVLGGWMMSDSGWKDGRCCSWDVNQFLNKKIENRDDCLALIQENKSKIFQTRSLPGRKLFNCDLQQWHSATFFLPFVCYICLSICCFVKGNACQKCAHWFV